MAVQTQIQTRRGTAASWTSTNPTLAAGEFGYETDTGKFKIGNGSTAWASLAYTAAATAVTYLFNATSGQTTFSGADANGLTLAYTVGAEQVYLNGVLQVRGSDYTATNGTSIVLTSGALTSDVLNVIAYSAMTITDTYTQAQADAKFVQQTNNFFAGKNKIINGDMGVWQRGTSITLSSGANGAYGPDRFIFEAYGSSTAATVTRQTFTPGTAPVAGYEGQYFARLTNFATATAWQIRQRIENVQTFAGQTVTFSFWAKASTSVALDQIQVIQNFGSGGSTAVTTVSTAPTLTTSWVRYTATVSVPSISGKTIGTSSYLEFTFYQGSGATNSSTIDTWGWQVETGSIATPFQTATGTLAGELAACQRYYYRSNGEQTGDVSAYALYGTGLAETTGQTAFYIKHPVRMRVKPTAFEFSQLASFDGVTITGSPTGTNQISANSTADIAYVTFTKAGSFTQFRPAFLINNNNNAGYIAFSAEL